MQGKWRKAKSLNVSQTKKMNRRFQIAPLLQKSLYGFIALSALSATAPLHAETRAYEIEAQPLDAALKAFALQSNREIFFAPDLTRGKQTRGIRGQYDDLAALQAILAETGLTYAITTSNAILVKQSDSDPITGSVGGSFVPVAQGEATNAGKRLTAEAGEQGASLQDPNSEGQRNKAGETQIEEIVVTAQKREENVEDVPISIAVLSGEELENSGVKNISELTYYVPSLASVELGPGFQNITIRGVGNVRGNSSLIGLYLDEAAVAGSNEQQIDLPLYDLARVEVLRGPQGTLYGEGSMGGTIRYITNDPVLNSFGGNLEVTAFDTNKGGMSEAVKGVANIPLIEDKLGIRIAAIYEDTAGWIDQPTAGREDINNSDLKNIRVKTLWRPNDVFNVKATAIVHRNEGDGYNYVNLGPNKDSNYLPALNPTIVTPYSDDYEHYGLTLDYDLGFASLISATSYTDMEKFTLEDYTLRFLPVGSPALGYHAHINQDIRFVTQELRLTSSDDKRLKWTVGAFYRDAKTSIVSHENFAGAEYIGEDSRDSSEALAFFGDAEYALTDRLTLGAGARYFKDRRSLDDHLVTAEFEETFNAVSPRAFISLAATPNINAYASVSKGFRSGGFNRGAAILLGASVGFDPEVLWTYELGTKMNFLDRRLRADLAFFQSDYDDYVSLGLVPGSSTLSTQTFNTGTVKIRGVEWQFLWNATDNLRLGFNGSLLDPEITKITALNPPTIVGDKPDNTPSEEYSVFLDSSFKWSASVKGFVRVNYNMQGKMYFHVRDGGYVVPVDSSDAVDFLDVHVGGQWDRWTAELFANNVLDESGFVTAYTSFGAGVQARPRSIGVKIAVEF